MLDDIKDALRITEDDFDNEINGLIEAAKEDLKTSGVAASNLTKPLCKQAIILYCKASFGYDNNEADRFMQSYEHIKKKIAITYREAIVEQNNNETNNENESESDS